MLGALSLSRWQSPKPMSVCADSSLVCPICLELYRDPKVLKCGHSLCNDCAISLEQRHSHMLECPQCRCLTHLPIGDNLPTNYALKDAVETAARLWQRNQQLSVFRDKLWAYEYPKARQAIDLVVEMVSDACSTYQKQRAQNELMWAELRRALENTIGAQCSILSARLDPDEAYVTEEFSQNLERQALVCKDEIDSHSLALDSCHTALVIELKTFLVALFQSHSSGVFQFYEPSDSEITCVPSIPLAPDHAQTSDSVLGGVRRFFGRMLYGSEPTRKCSSCVRNVPESRLEFCKTCASDDVPRPMCTLCSSASHNEHELCKWYLYKEQLDSTNKACKALLASTDNLMLSYERLDSGSDQKWVHLKNILAEAVDSASTQLDVQAQTSDKCPEFCDRIQQQAAELYPLLVDEFSKVDSAQIGLQKALLKAQVQFERCDLLAQQ